MTVGFADVVLDYFNSGAGALTGPYGGEGSRSPVPVNVGVVLGDDPNPNVDFLSLPTDSFVTVGFTDETITDGAGDDIFIQEIGPGGESANVFVSSNFVDFTFLGVARDDATTSFDLASIGFTEPVRAVHIVGLDSLGQSPGFDVVNVRGLPQSLNSSTIVSDSNTVAIFGNLVASVAVGYRQGLFFSLSAGGLFEISIDLSVQFQAGVFGSTENDQIVGSSQTDAVFASAGNDSLEGATGDDYLRGGDNDDRVMGGADRDIANGNRGNDLLEGDQGDDFLRGGQDNDTLMGGDGRDILVGDFGSDVLTGGSGADAFVLRAETAVEQLDPILADCICDFNPAEGDRIGLTSIASLQALAFFSIDVDGNGTADTAIQISETGEVLGVVLGVATATIESSLFIVESEDPAISFG